MRTEAEEQPGPLQVPLAWLPLEQTIGHQMKDLGEQQQSVEGPEDCRQSDSPDCQHSRGQDRARGLPGGRAGGHQGDWLGAELAEAVAGEVETRLAGFW